jgi:hypothetical protein
VDYPEPQRAEILDFLFKPGFGAGFQHLKVEIGSGENSTCGSEPSHVVTPEELADPKPRGYEFWLMAEARKRNPQIILDCLPWAHPYWVGNRFSQQSADWLAAFLKVARAHYGLELDWIAAAQNEMGTDLGWIQKDLRPTLDARDFAKVKLQAPARDSPARGSSFGSWARPASAAGWRPCWPADKPAGRSAAGGNGYAGQVRIAGRSGGTYAVGSRSWAAPKRRRPSWRLQPQGPRHVQREEDPAEEDRYAPGGKKTQAKKTRRKKTRPKKTTSSHRPIHHSFGTAMTQSRQRPENVKEQIVRQREFENIRLQSEQVSCDESEFSDPPLRGICLQDALV